MQYYMPSARELANRRLTRSLDRMKHIKMPLTYRTRKSKSRDISSRKARSEGYNKNELFLNLNSKFRNYYWENKLVKQFGPTFINTIRLYNFPIKLCNKIKTYKLLEENKTDEVKEKLKEIEANIETDLYHEMTRVIDKTNIRSSDKIKYFVNNLDLNSLFITSYQLAEKFAKESGDFELGPLLSTELFEFHSYAMFKNKKQEGLLTKHIDDRAGVSYPTITLIWYVIKDSTIEGGNIRFYKDFQDKKGIVINLWKSESNKNRKKCICLIFKGNLHHQPEELSGKGERSAIVFQFERIDIKSLQSTKKSSAIYNYFFGK